jgi:asparagine synthase (glutamine-hydrolysing)
MCGLAGFYSSEVLLQKADLENMINSIAHRGPDAGGVFMDKNIGLAHKRLAILDLSSLANQPFVSKSGKHIIVYNGEVFNFNELSKELDFPLKTRTDTEVVVELFEKFGMSFVDKLIGMFAMAIYAVETKELVLVRDRLGVKPLYYFWDGKDFVFASEIKALLTVDKIRNNLSLNHSSIASFLHLGFIPSPASIYNEIHKVPSGSYISINESGVKITQYWSPENKIRSANKQKYSDAKEELRELVESSVKYRLKSDVPVGILLSGGIDSSLIASVASKFASGQVNTFNIKYEYDDVDESFYSKKVAESVGSIHHEYLLTVKDAKEHLESVIDKFDEPFSDSSALPSFLASRMAAQYGKVLLSGEGGDELFMGYGTYNWSRRMSYPGVDMMKGVLAGLIDKCGGRRYKGRSNMFKYAEASSLQSHIFSQEQYFFSEFEIKQLLKPEYRAGVLIDADFTKLSRTFSLSEKQALFDIKYYLKDDLLIKTDMASMLNSIEARTPLVDHRIVEFALNLEEGFKVRKGQNKFILKDLLKDYISDVDFERPKKGFSIPLSRWLKTDLKYLIDDYLSEEEVNRLGVLDYKEVLKVKNFFFNGYYYVYVKLWTMIVLQKFLANYNKNIKLCRR